MKNANPASSSMVYQCGHAVPVEKIFSESTRLWAANRLCPQCWGKGQREKRAAEAIAEAKKLGLPALEGSEAQIAWAETIRTAWFIKQAVSIQKIIANAPKATDWIAYQQTGEFSKEEGV